MRDLLKAYIVVHACDFKRHWYDMEVSSLIDAAVAQGRQQTYTTDAHKDWRHKHKPLIEKMKQIVAQELLQAGYTVSLKGGADPRHPMKVVGVRPPTGRRRP